MTQDPFNQPRAATGGASFDWTEHLGQLVLVEPRGIQRGVQTRHGVADALTGDVTFLDTPNGAEEHLDAMIFPPVLISQCKDSINSMVLGRVATYTTQGGRETVQLGEYSPQDAQFAMSYLEHRKAERARDAFNQPQPGAAPANGTAPGQAPAQAPAAGGPGYVPPGMAPGHGWQQQPQPPAQAGGGYAPAGGQAPQQPPF